MNSVRISIIIVTWNGLHHLKKFFPEVWKYKNEHSEILIADNNSTDGTAEWLVEYYPECRHIKLDDNYGYCGGNNRAAQKANGDILLFLNNDVRVTHNWLEPILTHFDNDPGSAAAQPKIKDFTYPEYFEYAGAAGGFLDFYGYPFCRGRIFDTVEPDEGQYDQPEAIHWASGSALAVRKSLFDETGGFDECFEFHMEEIDLCWNLRNQGYEIRYLPDSEVYHLGGGSLSSGSYRKWYYNYRNNLSMLVKNQPSGTLASRLIVRMLLDGVAAIYALIKLNPSQAAAILHAHLAFYRLSPGLYSTRKMKMNKSDPTNWKEGMNLSIVWRYFIRGEKRYQDLR